MSAGLRAYPAYKDSGLPWIGAIPVGWEVRRLKHVCRIAYGDALATEDRQDGTIPVYGSNGIVGFHSEANTAAPVIMVGRKGSFGKVHLSEKPVFAIDTTLFIDRGHTSAHLPWLRFALTIAHLETLSQDTGVPGLSRTDAYSRPIPVPSSEEQQAIAVFINRETARIDELLREQEALLGELALRRDAVISEGATRGLGGVPLRESGVTWAGQVPAHWEFVKLRSVARLESGHTPSRSRPEYWENCTIPWVSLSDVRRFRDGRLKYIEDTEEKISELGMAHSAARLLPRGTVILSRTASVGFSAILGADMATTQDFANWVCGPRLLPEYLLYVLRGMKHEFARLMMGSTHQTIYMPDIRELQIPLPPLEEQQAIVQRLDTQLAQIDTLTAEVRASIALMRQHRSALITAAVTGKIDVRQA